MQYFLQDAEKNSIELSPELPTMKEIEVKEPINCMQHLSVSELVFESES